MSRRRVSLASLAFLFLWGEATHVSSQDRVIRFEPYASSDGEVTGPGELREIEISQGDSTLRVTSFAVPGPTEASASKPLAGGQLRLQRCCSAAGEREMLYDRPGQQGVVVRDAYTLLKRGELSPSALTNRTKFSLAETPTERALLVFSQLRVPYRGNFGPPCNRPGAAPRIDIFDGTTIEPLNRIDLQGRCPTMLFVPTRR